MISIFYQTHDPEERKPKKEEIIEDNLWKTTDIKEEEVSTIALPKKGHQNVFF